MGDAPAMYKVELHKQRSVFQEKIYSGVQKRVPRNEEELHKKIDSEHVYAWLKNLEPEEVEILKLLRCSAG